jgi:hypothetical protein
MLVLLFVIRSSSVEATTTMAVAAAGIRRRPHYNENTSNDYKVLSPPLPTTTEEEQETTMTVTIHRLVLGSPSSNWEETDQPLLSPATKDEKERVKPRPSSLLALHLFHLFLSNCACSMLVRGVLERPGPRDVLELRHRSALAVEEVGIYLVLEIFYCLFNFIGIYLLFIAFVLNFSFYSFCFKFSKQFLT